MARIPQLNGLIHTVYNSESDMARAMNWSKQRLNRITTGKKVPDLFDVNAMANALHTSFISVAQIFLPTESTNVDKNDDEEV